jgi:hypothetical protein
MAATAPRNVGQLGNDPLPWSLCLKQKGSTTAYPGTLAVLDGGYVKPCVAALGLIAVGFFDFSEFSSVNSGADGAVEVAVKPGCRPLKNSAGDDAVTQAHVGQYAYGVSDDTVACRANGARSAVGIIVAVDADGVWVLSGFAVNPGGLAGAGIQRLTGAFTAGVLALTTGFSLSASSAILCSRLIGAGTQGDDIRCVTADRTVGAPGTAAINVRSFLNGAAATADTSTIEVVIIG